MSLDAQYVESRISRHLHAKAAAAGIPLAGTFELTACCNLSCKMCYVRKTPEQIKTEGGLMDAGQWIEIAQKAKDMGMLYLLLTGGEPLTHPQFKQIYTAVRNMGLVVSINTNGTLIDDDMVSFFAANPPSRINLTLYGASRETYAELCGVPDAYDRAMHAVKALTAAGVVVKLNCSITPYNICDAEKILGIARENNVHLQVASYMFPPLRRIEDSFGENDRLTPGEDAEISMRLESLRLTDEQFRNRCSARLSGICDENDNECLDAPTEHIGCRAGSTSFWLKYNGGMNACGMMPNVSADVKAVGFEKAWELTKADTAAILLPAKCTSCEKRSVCIMCAAACYCESGAFDKVPEYLCRRTDAVLDICRKELENES